MTWPFFADLGASFVAVANGIAAGVGGTDHCRVTVRLKIVVMARRVSQARLPMARGGARTAVHDLPVAAVLVQGIRLASVEALRDFICERGARGCSPQHVDAIAFLGRSTDVYPPGTRSARGTISHGAAPLKCQGSSALRVQSRPGESQVSRPVTNITIDLDRDGRDRVVHHHRDRPRDDDRDCHCDHRPQLSSSLPSSLPPRSRSDVRRDAVVSYNYQRKEEGWRNSARASPFRTRRRFEESNEQVYMMPSRSESAGEGGQEDSDPNTTHCDITMGDVGAAVGGDGACGGNDGWMNNGLDDATPNGAPPSSFLPLYPAAVMLFYTAQAYRRKGTHAGLGWEGKEARRRP